MSVIDLSRRDKALHYLMSTDDPAAQARAKMLGLEKQEKTIFGMELLKLKGHDGTVGEKEARARCSESYRAWLEDYENAVADYEIFRNRRKTAELIVECWRSENANRRQGQV